MVASCKIFVQLYSLLSLRTLRIPPLASYIVYFTPSIELHYHCMKWPDRWSKLAAIL